MVPVPCRELSWDAGDLASIPTSATDLMSDFSAALSPFVCPIYGDCQLHGAGAVFCYVYV